LGSRTGSPHLTAAEGRCQKDNCQWKIKLEEVCDLTKKFELLSENFDREVADATRAKHADMITRLGVVEEELVGAQKALRRMWKYERERLSLLQDKAQLTRAVRQAQSEVLAIAKKKTLAERQIIRRENTSQEEVSRMQLLLDAVSLEKEHALTDAGRRIAEADAEAEAAAECEQTARAAEEEARGAADDAAADVAEIVAEVTRRAPR
jgi:hypothetical protein